MKKIISLLLLTLIIIACVACQPAQYEIQLGTSKLYLTIPSEYVKTETTFGQNQVAYYFKDDNSVSFDVYQWKKDSNYTVEQEAEYLATQFDVNLYKVTMDGMTFMKFTTNQTRNGNQRTVVNYLLDDGVYFIELCFWTNNEKTQLDFVNEVLTTIASKA